MNNKNMNSKTNEAALLAHSVIFLSTTITASIGIFQGAGSGQVGNFVIGLGYFKPFTMDSNILAAISSLILIIYGIRSRILGNDITPRWAVILQLMGAACLSLTMLVAALFLAPMEVLDGGSYFTMFSEDMFVFHLVNPVLSIISFTCLQKKYLLLKRECILGAIPTIIYSFMYLVMVVIVKQWDDFYGFTFGGKYFLIPAVFLVIYSLVLGASLLLICGHNRGILRT